MTTDLVLTDFQPGEHLALSEHVQVTMSGLAISEGATADELQATALGFDRLQRLSGFAVGDLGNFYRAHFPERFQEWVASYPVETKNTELDQKTIKVYMAVAAFYPADLRERFLVQYEGRRALSFSHFSRVRRYGIETATYWLERAATEDLSLTQLDEILAAADGGVPGADDVPPIPATPTSKKGEAYWLGPPEDPQRHLLVCGDSKDPAMHAYVAHMFSEATPAISCLWTDPPYGVDYVSIGRQIKANKKWKAYIPGSPQGQTHAVIDAGNLLGAGQITQEEANRLAGVMTIENDGIGDIDELLAKAWANLAPYLIPGCPFYVAGPSGQNMETFIRSFREAGWNYKQMLVWVKQTMVFGRSDYHLQHEPVFYGYTKGDQPRGRIQGLQGKDSRWYGDNSQVSTMFVDRPRVSDEHPTTKPTKLITQHILNSSAPGDIVADPFSGSGSTLIAADMLGRRAFCIEYDERYADVIRARYQRYLEEQAASGIQAAPRTATGEHQVIEHAPATMPED